MIFRIMIFTFLLAMTTACGGGGGGANDDGGNGDNSNNGGATGNVSDEEQATLKTLELSTGMFNTDIAPEHTGYTATLSNMTNSIRIRGSAWGEGTIRVNGEIVTAGSASAPIGLAVGLTTVDVVAASANGLVSNSFTLELTRQSVKPFTQTDFIKASNTQEIAKFGNGLFVKGNTMVVGAISEHSGSTGSNGDQFNSDAEYSGAVYIFERENGEWQQQTYLKPSNTSGTAAFGLALALDNDTLVVGAYKESSGGSGVNPTTNGELDRSGAAYVFVRNNGQWEEQAFIKAEDPQELYQYGFSAAIFGDTMVIGAPGWGLAGPAADGFVVNHEGAAYIYTRTNGVWSFHSKVTAPFPLGGDRFGQSVIMDEDTIIIGAPGEDSDAQGLNGDQDDDNAESAGAVYIYQKVADEWTLQTFLKSSNNREFDYFGYKLALEGDLLVVTSQGDESNDEPENSGAVYIFSKSAGWNEVAKIKPNNPTEGLYFGECVAINGNFMVVGSDVEDGRGSGIDPDYHDTQNINSGAAYLFELQNSQWNQVAYLKASNVQETGRFGWTCSMGNDFVVVSAFRENTAGRGINPSQNLFNTSEGSGAVHIYPID